MNTRSAGGGVSTGSAQANASDDPLATAVGAGAVFVGINPRIRTI